MARKINIISRTCTDFEITSIQPCFNEPVYASEQTVISGGNKQTRFNPDNDTTLEFEEGSMYINAFNKLCMYILEADRIGTDLIQYTLIDITGRYITIIRNDERYQIYTIRVFDHNITCINITKVKVDYNSVSVLEDTGLDLYILCTPAASPYKITPRTYNVYNQVKSHNIEAIIFFIKRYLVFNKVRLSTDIVTLFRSTENNKPIDEVTTVLINAYLSIIFDNCNIRLYISDSQEGSHITRQAERHNIPIKIPAYKKINHTNNDFIIYYDDEHQSIFDLSHMQI